VPCSMVSCSNAFNDGSQLSEHARSAFLGIGSPTVPYGSLKRLATQIVYVHEGLAAKVVHDKAHVITLNE
jgi:hypothetical protein